MSVIAFVAVWLTSLVGVLGSSSHGRRGESEGDAEPPVEQLLYTDSLLWVALTQEPETSLVRLIGEIDFTNADAVADALAGARSFCAALVIDIEQLSFVDVAGIRALAVFSHENAVPIRNVPSYVKRAVELLDLPPLG
ncbi:STAS domain-containing protein [Nonomuraea sp. NPDC050643]|uniref:STAS domain-containing protein n=1 Tax=Nonomuraea sp. NPDC050643 TaxID=3155660 RepID=UPI0033EE1379